MTDLRLSQLVSAPLNETFNCFAHFEAYPEFMSSVDRVRRDDSDPDQVHWIFSLGGMMRQYTTETEVDPGAHQINWTSVTGPEHSGAAALADRGNGETDLHLTVHFQPHGVAEHLADTLKLVRHRLSHDLRQFARYVESRGLESPTRRRVADTPTPDDRARAASERLTDLLFGRDNS